MNIATLAAASSRPYSTLLREAAILGRLFSSKQLTFNMEAQTQSNWCWAATATSVSHFYWLMSTWTQCLVARAELPPNNCCATPVPSACNVPWYLDRALTRTNNFVSIAGPVSFETVRAEIDAGRPVGARVGWSGGGGHFMVIYGYSVVGATQYFDIDDPIYGKSHLTVAAFSTSYQGSGTWTTTYFTKSFIKMPIKLLIPEELVLRRIWEVRPLLNLKRDLSFTPNLSGGGGETPENASVGMAQRVYSLGLDSLLTAQPLPQPVNLRVYELEDNKPRAFFDVSESPEPQILQMSTSAKHFETFERGLSTVLSHLQTDRDAELRLFRVPALNFEAFWVHADDGEDSIVPISWLGPIPQYEVTPFEKALAILTDTARSLPNIDDESGA